MGVPLLLFRQPKKITSESEPLIPFTDDFNRGDGSLDNGWSASDTWQIVSNALGNTPGEGANLITDPGIEAWTSATNATNYTENLAGTSTINQETSEVHGGSSAARADIDASNSNGNLQQALNNLFAANDWAVVRAWLKNSTTGKTCQLRLDNQTGIAGAVAQPTLTTSYVQYTSTCNISNRAACPFQVNKISAASSSIYIDDVEAVVLTYADLFALREAGAANCDVRISITKAVLGGNTYGKLAGVVLCANSLTSPTSYVAAIYSNDVIYLIQDVAGTHSQLALISSGTNYVAGAQLRMTFDGSVVKVYYNGSQVGTAGGYSINAALTTNTKHGIMCPSQGVTLDSFFLGLTA